MTVRRELLDLIGSGVLVAGLGIATIAALAPPGGAAPPAPAGDAVADSPAGSQPVATSPGGTLFFAKGCAACHSLAALGHHSRFSAGPDLSTLPRDAASRRAGLNGADYVRESMRQPQAFLASGAAQGGLEMPVLTLSEAEVEALTAFLLASR